MRKLTTGPAVKNHISPKMARELNATYQTMCHSWSLVNQRVLRQPHRISSASSSQGSASDVRRYAENPVPERSRSTSEELRGNPLHRSTETENTHKNEGREEVQSDLLHVLRDWLQEFRENLVDESSPLEPRGNPELGCRDTSSSSHELPMESRAKVEPGSV